MLNMTQNIFFEIEAYNREVANKYLPLQCHVSVCLKFVNLHVANFNICVAIYRWHAYIRF